MQATDLAAQRVQLRDGRTLVYAEYGEPNGAPLLFFHGTPGSRLQLRDIDATARRMKVRVLVPDRPGYGESTPQPGRTVGQYADDIRELTDQLGLDRFAVAGISGGGGYATACAVRLPGRVTTAIVIAGMAPATKAVLAQMRRKNRTVLSLARRAPWLLGPMMARTAAMLADPTPKALDRLAKGLPAADGEIIRRPQMLATFAADMTESMRQGAAATVEDLRLYTRPYDFALGDIVVPVHLFHGDADANVPIALGRDVAARIPGCAATFIPGAGHMWFIDHFEEILTIAATADQQRSADPGRRPAAPGPHETT
jgi:pimeloyl-ACP methyl ester carboxylesterase